jgi:hypothetical protein
MNLRFSFVALPAVLAASTAVAQGLPTSQPTQVTIIREQVKLGREVDHARIEAGWPAAYAKAKSPTYYLAMTSLTGASEAWFVVPFASNAAAGDDMKLEATDTVLAAELQRLGRADAEVVNESRTIQTMARTDLSHGAFPDMAKQRFWEVSLYRVRPGHEGEFEAAAKAYGAAAERVAPGVSYRVYAVTAGMPAPAFFVFSSVESYAQFDQMTADGQKIFQSFTPDELATINKFFTDAEINEETNRFQLDPQMSYVPAATRATDPAFWLPKRPARRP